MKINALYASITQLHLLYHVKVCYTGFHAKVDVEKNLLLLCIALLKLPAYGA